jgi:tRNA U34 5-methylaminomethyl-2-thiouridine-forming methyltransferase MnmC
MLKQNKTKTTGDGSITFFNNIVKEHYHSLDGAQEEALTKYIIPSKLEERFKDKAVTLLDVCFGLGYNSLLAIEETSKLNGKINITALELDREIVGEASEYVNNLSGNLKWENILSEIYHNSSYSNNNINIEMIWGDARQSCNDLITGGMQYDLIFHDPFSTQRNAELWTVDFFRKLYKLLNSDGMILTYSTALPVLVGFLDAGFHIGRTKQKIGTQRVGLAAAKCKNILEYPYSNEEICSITESLKAIPYRDISQKSSNREILKERNEKVVFLK